MGPLLDVLGEDLAVTLGQDWFSVSIEGGDSMVVERYVSSAASTAPGDLAADFCKSVFKSYVFLSDSLEPVLPQLFVHSSKYFIA